MRIRLLCPGVALTVALFGSAVHADVPSNMTIQGQLRDSTGAVIDTANIALKFTIYDDSTAGVRVWPSIAASEQHSLTTDFNGLWTTIIGTEYPIPDSVFGDTSLWLEIIVFKGVSLGTPLPRVKLNTGPFAFRAAWAQKADSASAVIGNPFLPVTGGTMTGPITSTGDPAITMGDGNFGTGNTNTGVNSFVAGRDNAAGANWSTISGGRDNSASTTYSTIGGGRGNTAGNSAAVVAGGVSNEAMGEGSSVGGGWINVATGNFSTIGGGLEDTASGAYSTIGGGNLNVASDTGAIVGGGSKNAASGYHSTVGGGQLDTASGSHSAIGGGFLNNAIGGGAVVGGGYINYASGDVATISGGFENFASGETAVTGGGRENTAAGLYATVPGGYRNAALGKSSVAIGQAAKANHNGSIVIAAISTSGDLDSTRSSGINQIVLRANGGYYLTNQSQQANIPAGDFLNTSTGAHLTIGGVWTNSSDANQKENFSPVDGAELLERIRRLSIQEWNYKAEEDAVRHIGPTAQDFHSLFSVGTDDKTISTIDPAGIALAAIQELHRQIEELRAINESLREQISEIERRQ